MDGGFGVDGHGSDWIILRHILREKGVPLAGPSLASLIDPITPNDLRRATLATLQEWWSPPFPSPERFESDAYRAYAMLTMCRAQYTMQYGAVVSKVEAARWAQRVLGAPWAGLVDKALAYPHTAEPVEMGEMLDFIHFSLVRISHMA
jgi:hypothetical protein